MLLGRNTVNVKSYFNISIPLTLYIFCSYEQAVILKHFVLDILGVIVIVNNFL